MASVAVNIAHRIQAKIIARNTYNKQIINQTNQATTQLRQSISTVLVGKGERDKCFPVPPPYPTPKNGLSKFVENLFLDGIFSSKNAKLRAENSRFRKNSERKLKFRTLLFSSVRNLQLFVGILTEIWSVCRRMATFFPGHFLS